ncbi:Nucleolar protein 12 [Allomyces arbusculus]|nr:Nucleolar protein 12 [Allomyces arbusculus]
MSGFDALFKRDPTKFDAELDSLFAVSKTAAKPAPAAAPAPSKKQAVASSKQPAKKPATKPRSAAVVAVASAASSDEASDEDEGSDEDDESDDDEDVAMAAASDNEAESTSGDSDDDEEEEEDGDEDDDEEEAADGSDAGEEDEDVSESADDATPGDAPTTAAQDEKPKSKKQLEKEKLTRTVFVGNVTIKASEKLVDHKFKQLFAEYGKVESVRYRSIAFSDALPRKLNFKLKNFHPSRDTMHAYVVFTDAASARKAAGAVNGTVFESKHLRTDYCGPDAPAAAGDADDDEAVAKRSRDPKRCVFVGNVPFDVEDEELWEFFGQVAEVDSVRVIRDRKLGIGKGFAYVQFKERSSVPLALKLHETKFRNKPLRIFKCMKETGPGATGPQQQQQQKGRGGSSGKGGRPGAGPSKPGVAGKPSKKRTRDSNDDGEPAKKRARKPKTSKAAASWKKGHEAKKRKTAAELPRKLAKKVKKLNAQSGKK